MSSSLTTTRPAFSNAEEEPILSKPVSKMAVFSLILGAVSLLSPITGSLFSLAIAATIIGLVSSVLLCRTTSTHSGGWIANIGLFLGLVSLGWSSITAKAEREYTTIHASEFASHFLDVLADGNVHAAAELQLPLGQRQLPGLDLVAYYESHSGNATEKVFGSDDSMPDLRAMANKRFIDLRSHAVTIYVQKFPNAKWEFERIGQVLNTRAYERLITVILVNSEEPGQKIAVTLNRQERQSKEQVQADWNVKDMMLL